MTDQVARRRFLSSAALVGSATVVGVMAGADPADAAVGPSAGRSFDSLTDLRGTAGTADGEIVQLLGVTSANPAKGGGPFRWSAASTATDDGVTVIVVTGLSTGRWLRIYAALNVQMFGAVGDGATDDTTALQAARDYLAGLSGPVLPALDFPAGDYLHSQSPNWAIAGLVVRFLGTCYLTNTGPGPCVLIDGGATSGKVSNVTWGQVGQGILRGGPSTGGGFQVRAIERSAIRGRVYGCGTSSAALSVQWGVLINFDVNVTSDETGSWYLGGQPYSGYTLSQRNAGELTSYCTFVTPSVQSTVFGLYLDYTLGNVFIGGDFEYCTQYGAVLTPNAYGNKFFGTDFEVNTTADISCAGHYTELHGCDSGTLVEMTGGDSNRIMGGNFQSLTIASGVVNTLVSGLQYRRAEVAGTGVFTDNGTRTRVRDILDLTAGAAGGTAYYTNTPLSATTVTPTGSPFTVTNTTGNDQTVSVSGGTVTKIQRARSGTTLTAAGTTGEYDLSPSDALIVTYSSAPTIVTYTR